MNSEQPKDVCSDCAELFKGTAAFQAEISAPMRKRTLLGEIVQCDICGEFRSIWLDTKPRRR